MIEDMPRPRPLYLTRETRNGKTWWYFRVDKGPRTPLPGAYMSPEFMEAYRAALHGKPITFDRKPNAGAIGWLIDRYQGSTAWAGLSVATRRQRSGILKQVSDSAGSVPYRDIGPPHIREGVERRKEKPAAARHFVETMRGLFKWAVESGFVDTDPTRDVKAPKKRTDGHHTWTPEEVAKFEQTWPLGTRERLAFDVLRYTGLRRSDAVLAGRQHIRDGVLTIRTAKTGEIVYITVSPNLALSLAAGPTGDLAFIAGERGRPLTKEAFGNWFRKVCTATGLSHCSAHGIRKHVATSMAENGATVAHMEAMLGWRGGGMASLYTRKADRARLAKAAMAFLSPTASYELGPHEKTIKKSAT